VINLKNWQIIKIVTLVVSFSFVGSGCQVNGEPVFNQGFLDSVAGEPEVTDLTLKVRQALSRNGQTVNQRITVSILSEGSIKLSGFVPDSATFHEAERVAYGVEVCVLTVCH